MFSDADENLSGSGNANTTSKVSVDLTEDDDGDLLLPRVETIRNVLKIIHSQYTDVESVGLQVWSGALLLADFIMHEKSKFKGKRILELGSGTGLVGIVAAMYCEHVTCTDLNHDGILEMIGKNFEYNRHLLEAEFLVQEFDFSKEWTSDVRSIVSGTDIVLASELVYDNDITDHLINTFATILSARPEAEIYFTVEKRYVFTMLNLQIEAKHYDYFFEKLAKMTGDSRWRLVRVIDVPSFDRSDLHRNIRVQVTLCSGLTEGLDFELTFQLKKSRETHLRGRLL